MADGLIFFSFTLSEFHFKLSRGFHSLLHQITLETEVQFRGDLQASQKEALCLKNLHGTRCQEAY